MKIFFTSSIRGLREFEKNYDLIYKLIKELGHKYIGNYPFRVTTRQVYLFDQNKNMELFNDMQKFMNECDLMILEVSKHSVSMGYMIMKVLSMKKPVIALHTKENKPAFLVGIEDDNFQLIEYDPKRLKKTLRIAISFASNTGDSRFNLMLSPNMNAYLAEAAKKREISKAQFIRELIEKSRLESN